MSFGTDIDAIRAHKALSEPCGEVIGASGYIPLNNAISVLWQQPNFRKENKIDGLRPLVVGDHPEWFDDPQGIISDDIYERMKPALRLASLLHTCSEAFFIKIYQAKVINVNGITMLDDDYHSNDKDERVYRTMVQSLSQTMRIYTGSMEDKRHRHANASSSSSPLDQIPELLQLNSDYIDWYSRDDYDSQDVQKKNTIAFGLAVTLVHEHAHTVWHTRTHIRLIAEFKRLKRQLGALEASKRAKVIEPYHSWDDLGSELGLCWERYWFGGLFPHFNLPEGTLNVQAVTGTSWRTWNNLDEKAEPTTWVVAIRTYNQFFNKLAWQAEIDSLARAEVGKEVIQVGGKESHGQLAVYLTSLRVIKSWPVYSTEYDEFYKKHLDAIARGLHVDTVYHVSTE